MADLELELRLLGQELLVPSSPALPASVRGRITAMPAPDRVPRWRRWAMARSPLERGLLLAAALVLLGVGVVAGSATLGLPGLSIVFGPVATPIASTAPGTASPSVPTTGPLGSDLGLGEPIALEATHGSVPFAVVVPTDPRLGALGVVWWDAGLGDGQVALVWPATSGLPAIDDAGIGAILTETPGRTDEGLVRKTLGPGTTVEPVTVGGAPGFWISGAPHDVLFMAADGRGVQDRRRVVGDTLTWWRDGILYRLESRLGRDEAIEVTETMP